MFSPKTLPNWVHSKTLEAKLNEYRKYRELKDPKSSGNYENRQQNESQRRRDANFAVEPNRNNVSSALLIQPKIQEA